MLSVRTIFLIGVGSGVLAILMWLVIIFSSLGDSLKLSIFIIGVFVCVGLPQAYIEGRVRLPSLERVIVPDNFNTRIKQFRRFSILFSGFFSPVIVSVFIYILWVKST
jgi:hypothetical protein